MVPFAGWEMPIQFRGVSEEHRAVRTAAGIFDVSHMGELLVQGGCAANFLNFVVTNDLTRSLDGQALYTCACNQQGTILDDLIIYRVRRDQWLVVCNASNRAKMFAHLRAAAVGRCDVTVEDVSDATAMLALQGPNAVAIAARAAGDGGRLTEIPSFRSRRPAR